MTVENPKRTQWPRFVAGTILLLLTIIAIIFFSRERKSPGSESGTTLAGTGSVPASVAGATTNLAATNTTASLVGPRVAELLQLMREWRQRNPNYHVVVRTTGPDLDSSTEVYRYTTDQGTMVTRIKSEFGQPTPLSMVMEIENERVRAYFPASNQVVELDPAQETARFLAQVGWVAGDLDLMAPVRLAKASFVEVGPDYQALTMVFPGAVFQMPRTAGDLFLTIRIDETGKALALEQLTLGMRAVSKLTYPDEALAQIQENSPKIPARAVATKKSFKEALQEEVNRIKTTPTKPV